MNYIDQLADEEILLLNAQVENATQTYREISLLFKDTSSISNSLELANDYINRKDYANAYRCFLHSLTYLIQINEQVMEKYSTLQNILSKSDDAQEA